MLRFVLGPLQCMDFEHISPNDKVELGPAEKVYSEWEVVEQLLKKIVLKRGNPSLYPSRK